MSGTPAPVSSFPAAPAREKKKYPDDAEFGFVNPRRIKAGGVMTGSARVKYRRREDAVVGVARR